MKDRPNIYVISLSAALAMVLGQFSVNIVAPLQFEISSSLQTSDATVRLSIAIFLLAFAFSQLSSGFLVNGGNARKILLSSTLMFAIAGCFCAIATDPSSFQSWRAVQGIASGAAVVSARSILAYIYRGDRLVKSLGITNILFATAPGIAPLLATLGHDIAHWRVIILLPVLLAVWAYFAVLNHIEERHFRPSSSQAGDTSLRTLFLNIAQFGLVSGLVYAAFYAFISDGPRLLVQDYSVGLNVFGVFVAFLICSFIAGSMLSSKLVAKIGSVYAFGVSLSLATMAASICWLMMSLESGPIALAVILSSYFFMTGVLMPISISKLIECFPSRNALGIAIIGTLHLLGGAWGTAFVEFAPRIGSGFGFSIATSSFAAFILFWFIAHYR